MAKSNSKSMVPEARDALDRFKMEAASEVDVPLHIKIKACENIILRNLYSAKIKSI